MGKCFFTETTYPTSHAVKEISAYVTKNQSVLVKNSNGYSSETESNFSPTISIYFNPSKFGRKTQPPLPPPSGRQIDPFPVYLLLVPFKNDQNSGSIEWGCIQSQNLELKWLPANCRATLQFSYLYDV